MKEPFRVLEGVEAHLQEGKFASVLTGNKLDGSIILRFDKGIEWRTKVEDKEFLKSLPEEAFVTGTRWEFDSTGVFVQVHVPEGTVAKKGRATGSLKQMPASA